MARQALEEAVETRRAPKEGAGERVMRRARKLQPPPEAEGACATPSGERSSAAPLSSRSTVPAPFDKETLRPELQAEVQAELEHKAQDWRESAVIPKAPALPNLDLELGDLDAELDELLANGAAASDARPFTGSKPPVEASGVRRMPQLEEPARDASDSLVDPAELEALEDGWS